MITQSLLQDIETPDRMEEGGLLTQDLAQKTYRKFELANRLQMKDLLETKIERQMN